MTLQRDRVLIVEDEFLIAEGLRMQVEDLGLTVCGVAATAEDAETLAREHQPYLVLMDVRIVGERDGVDAAKAIHDQVGARVVFVTGSREPATLERIEHGHPAAVLFKPVSDKALRDTISRILAA